MSVSRIILFLIFLLPGRTLAETVMLNGIPFTVERFDVLDNSSVAVQVNGQQEILGEPEARDFVVRKSFESSDIARAISRVALEEFATTSLRQGKKAWAEEALLALIRYHRSQVYHVRAFLLSFSRMDGASDLFKEILDRLPVSVLPPELGTYMFLHVALHDLAWARAYRDKFRSLIGDQLKEALITEYLNRISDLDSEARLLEIVDLLYGAQHPTAKAFHQYSALFEKLRAAQSEADIEALAPRIEQVRGDTSLDAALEPLVVRSVHQAAESALQRGEGAGALYLLGRLGFSRRTNQTHQLVVRGFSQLNGSAAAVLHDAITERFLFDLAKVDDAVRQSFVSQLEKSVYQQAGAQQPEKAEILFESLRLLRTDPDRANDSIRFALAMAYKEKGRDQTAKELISAMETGIPLFKRIRLLFSGLYINVFVLIVVIVMPFLCCLYLFLRHLRKEKIKRMIKIREAWENAEDERGRPQGFRFTGTGRKKDPMLVEYDKLLKEFHLEPTANLKQIKVAYRNLAKEVHPDTAKDKSEEAQDRFLELTNKYERIMEIRKLIGMDS